MNRNELSEMIAQLLVDKPIMIRTIKDRYLNDDLWMYCIEREPTVFKHKKNPSYPLCLFAVTSDGYNLKYIDKHMIDEAMCIKAVMSNPIAIQYVPSKFKSNALIEMAIDASPNIISNFNDLSEDFLMRQVRKHPSIIRNINNPSDELICVAIKEEPNIILYFDNPSRKMVETLKDNYPDLIQSFPHLNSVE